MKWRVTVFICGVVASILLIPAINVASTVQGAPVDWGSKKFLSNIDFAIAAIAGVLSPSGISIDPDRVIIGQDGWLFLGDNFQSTVTEDRRTATPADAVFGMQVHAATAAWDSFMAERGVKAFKIIVGPNKGTIYPEHLPEWMRPSPPTVMDAFLAEAGPAYIDLRPVLLNAKDNFNGPIYYRTDTHWNYLGAGVAFRQFAAEIAVEDPDLRWPSVDMYRPIGTGERAGGDLSAFLHRSAAMSDTEPRVGIFEAPVRTKRTDWETGEVTFVGANEPVGLTPRPIVVHADGALNQRKVLWLRDSFGTALSPFMAATFSDVLQLHWSGGFRPGVLDDLVERWKPDYVFVTVVERSARDGAFASFPPLAGVEAASPFSLTVPTQPGGHHFVEPGSNPDEFVVSGADPQLVFLLPDPLPSSDPEYLRIDLTCQDGAAEVPLQLFWSTRNAPAFDESRSVKFKYVRGHPLIPLHGFGLGAVLPQLYQIRLDIDRPGVCTSFRLSPPGFGIIAPASKSAL